MKLFFLSLSEEIEFPAFERKLVFATGLIFFLVSIINVAGMLYETRAPKGVIYAKDNDAGRGVQTATLTRWWNSNHFAPYGNLYFRFAHTLAHVVPADVDKNLVPDEQNEVRHHFALMLTSLLFLSSLCLFLSMKTTGDWTKSLFLSAILLKLGTYDWTWVEFLFRAHPDHALMFFCLISSYFTLKYTNSNSRRDFILAAIFWGLATAVKRSTVLFIPSFIYLFLSEGLNKDGLKKGFQFIGYMLLAYLIIGFPQNFGFYKHIRFMYIETFNSLPPTKDSAFEYLGLIFEQSIWIWVAVVVGHLLAGKKENLLNKRFIIFCLIALVVVLSGRMSTRHNHHIMPHVALFFMLLLYSIKNLPVLRLPKPLVVFVVISTGALFFLPESKALKERKDVQLDCRKEITDVLSVTANLQTTGLLIRDPYFPFSAKFKETTKQIWGVNGEILDKENALLWGTQKTHLLYLSRKPYRPHIYPDLTEAQWNAKVDLAKLAQTDSSFTTPAGKVFEKIHEDRCGFQVWKRKD